jgi:hypothetical protein
MSANADDAEQRTAATAMKCLIVTSWHSWTDIGKLSSLKH